MKKQKATPKPTTAATTPSAASTTTASLPAATKPYRIAFDALTGTLTGCTVRVQLKQGGQAGIVVPINPAIPVVVTVEPAAAAQAVLIAPASVGADQRHVDLRVDPGPAYFNGVPPWPPPQTVTLRVKASPLLPPLPGVPIDLRQALPAVEGCCVVQLDTPPDRIHVVPPVERIVLDSASGRPQPVRMALQRYRPDLGAYKSDFDAPPEVALAFTRGQDIVQEATAKPGDNGVVTFAPVVGRVLLGDGKDVDLFVARATPPPAAAAAFAQSGGQPRAIAYAATTSTPKVRITVWTPRDERTRRVLGFRDVACPAERLTVQVRQKTGRPTTASSPPLYVDVDVVSGPARMASSHWPHIDAVPVGADLRTGPIDLRRVADSLTSDTEVTVEVDDSDVGPFFFTATKPGCAPHAPVDLADFKLDEATRSRLRQRGGVLLVRVDLALTLDGKETRTPMVEPAGELTVGDATMSGRWDIDAQVLRFDFGDKSGPPITVGPVPLALLRELEERLGDVVGAAAAIDPRLKEAAIAFGAEVVRVVAVTPTAQLEPALPDLERRVALTAAALRGAGDLAAISDTALEVREQAIARQQGSMIGAFIELSSFSLQRGVSWWKGDGDTTKQALIEGAEHRLKDVVRSTCRNVSQELSGARARLAAWVPYRITRDQNTAALERLLAMPLEQRKSAREALAQGLRSNLAQVARLPAEEINELVLRRQIGLLSNIETGLRTLEGASGEAFETQFKQLIESLHALNHPSTEHLQALQLQLAESLTPKLETAMADITASVAIVNERLGNIATIRGTPADPAFLAALEQEANDLVAMQAVLKSQAAAVEQAFHTGQEEVAAGLRGEAIEMVIADILNQGPAHAKAVHAAAASPPPRVHVGREHFENAAWGLLHAGLQLIGDLVSTVIGAIPAVPYLLSCLGDAGKWLAGKVATITRWLIESFESANPALSALDADRLARGSEAVAREATLPTFMAKLREQQLALSRLTQTLDPTRLCGTFDRDGRAVVVDRFLEPARADLAERSADQRRLLQAFAITTAERMLDPWHVSMPLSAATARGIADDLAASRGVAAELPKFARGLGDSTDNVIAFGRTLASDDATFADVDTAIDWVVYLLTIMLRAGAALGAFTGVGVVGSVTALAVAEIVDLVGANLRVVVTSCLTIRRLNGIPADCCMLTALVTEGLVGRPR